MLNFKTMLAAGAMATALASAAFASPAYIKFDGVDGEVKSASFGRASGGMQSLDLTTGEDPVAIGLLLPAVQKVREAASRSSAQGRPRSFSTLRFEDDRAGKIWTLHNAQATPAGRGNRVKILFRCKDWTDMATGEQGSDCAGARNGKVETTWKVEKGEK